MQWVSYIESLCKWFAENRLRDIAKKTEFTKSYNAQETVESHDHRWRDMTRWRNVRNIDSQWCGRNHGISTGYNVQLVKHWRGIMTKRKNDCYFSFRPFENMTPRYFVCLAIYAFDILFARKLSVENCLH